jgi:site-specific DNA-methyltransferase (adenine-specific)
MNKELMFSSKSEEWSTPDLFYRRLHEEFNFELDAAATEDNAKCDHYYTKADNGLNQPWAPHRVWVNPPYGRNVTGLWIEKAFLEARHGALVVMLLPARTDTAWFHDFIFGRAELRFVRGRLKFGGAPHGAPFPSMLAIFRP